MKTASRTLRMVSAYALAIMVSAGCGGSSDDQQATNTRSTDSRGETETEFSKDAPAPSSVADVGRTAPALDHGDAVAIDSSWPDADPLPQHVQSVRVIPPEEYEQHMSFPREQIAERVRDFYQDYGLKVVVGDVNEEKIEEDAILWVAPEVKTQFGGREVTISLRWVDEAQQFAVPAGRVSMGYHYKEEKLSALVPPLFVRDTRRCLLRSLALDTELGSASSIDVSVCSDDGRYVFHVKTNHSVEPRAYELRVLDARRESALVASRPCVGGGLAIRGDSLCCFGDAGLEVYDLSKMPDLGDPMLLFAERKVSDVGFTERHMVVVADRRTHVISADLGTKPQIVFTSDSETTGMVTSESGRLWMFRPMRTEETETSDGEDEGEKPLEIIMARIGPQGEVDVTSTTTVSTLGGGDLFALGETMAAIGPYSGDARLFDLRGGEPKLIGSLAGFPVEDIVVVRDMIVIAHAGALRIFSVHNPPHAVHVADIPQITLEAELNATGMYFAFALADLGQSRLRVVGDNIIALREASKITLNAENSTSPGIWTQVIELPPFHATALEQETGYIDLKNDG